MEIVTTILSPHKSVRTHKIDRLTVHCVVGQCTAEALGNWFANPQTKASSNYGVDKDGRVGLYVPENERSWCSSNTANDDRAITIECASDTYDPYVFTESCYQGLISLCVDICKRYGKKKLLWLEDKETTEAYQPKDDEMVITLHRCYANKQCPGQWFVDRLPEFVKEVTARLEAPSAWAKESCEKAVKKGIVQGYGDGTYGWQDNITREQMIVILDRLGLI